MGTYVNVTYLNSILDDYASLEFLTTNYINAVSMGSYATVNYVLTQLTNYVNYDALSLALQSYKSVTSFNSDIANYVLTTTLENYVT